MKQLASIPNRFLFIMCFAVSVSFLPLNAQVVINEYSASNLTGYLDNYSSSEDWIELYNNSSSEVNLTGYYLSDKLTNPEKWAFPEGSSIAANGYLTVWCSGRNEALGGHIHTNFKLKQTLDEPETIVLSNPSGEIIDEFELFKTQLEHSMARNIDGTGEMKICTNPTKGTSNNSSNFYDAYAIQPTMDKTAGFYENSITVGISTTEPNSVIHYTTDGSRPTSGSPVYSSPINVTETNIVKAIAISSNSNILNSFIEFNTYFINENHKLVVLSTSSNDLEELLNGNQSLLPHGTMEFFNLDHERTSYGYGEYNKHGQDSWQFPHRSFDYIARDEMGYSDAIHEKLMPYSDREEYQRIIIRASGDDNYPGIDSSAHMRDMFIQTVADINKLNVDLRRAQRCVVYVNGQFWGVYSIRERPTDHDYTDYYYEQDKYNIYYLMNWGYTWAEYGGADAFADWNSLHDYAMDNDMSDPERYKYVSDRLDITSLVDYVLVNSYVVCTDWVTWNTAWWRGLNPDGGHQKWGYILWDEDATFNHYINYTNVPDETPYASPCFPEGITPSYDPEEHIVLLNKLMENPEFYQYYVSRYTDLHNTVFKKEALHALIDTIKNQISFDMQYQIQRWGGNFSQWEQNVQKIKDFITVRDEVFASGLIDCYNLNGPYDITVNIAPEGVGKVKVNSIYPKEYPWEGFYFGGIETKLKATSTSPGYVFDHWELNNHTVTPSSNDDEVSLMLTQGDNIVAHFTQAANSDSLVISEINYKSNANFDVGDWVEFYNPMPYNLDISNWYFKDAIEENSFVFPEGTTIDPNGFLVLVRDSAAFMALFPSITNFIGEMSFNLSAGGELISLYNENGTCVDFVEYDDEDPWPIEPDGNGPTLELISASLDNALPESWMASDAEHGTPGGFNSIGIEDEHRITELQSVQVYPNPFNEETHIRFISNQDIKDGVLDIYNTYGDKVMTIENINVKELIFKKNNLSKGIYFCRFHNQKNQQFEVTKIIIQ